MPAKRKQTIKRKTAGKKSGKANQQSTLLISVHRTQAVFLLLLFAMVGVLMGVGVWKAGSAIANYMDRSSRYDKMIVAAGRRNGVYPPLLKAVIWKESRFDASARGSRARSASCRSCRRRRSRTGKIRSGVRCRPTAL